MSDANKTELTKRVTAATVLWLEERGFRPVESECSIERGWCADIASIGYLTRTEAKSLKLLEPQPNVWKPGMSTEEYKAAMQPWRDEYAGIPRPVTVAVEVKTSVNDFRRDNKFTRANPTHLMYLAMVRGMVPLDAIDARWGVLAFDEKDSKVKRVRHATIQVSTIEQALRVAVEIAMRRDNFTRYERWREFDRQAREHNNERENRHRISAVVSAVLDIQSGKYGIDDAFAMNGCRTKSLSKYLRERLESLVPTLEKIA